jgi:acyl-CoA reductase-like NAD-dependent aldehyde dehydrogenase
MKEKTLKRLEAAEARAPAIEDPGAAMESVRRQLDRIAARLRAQPGWKEPSAAERAATMRRVADVAARHGGPPPWGT